MELILTKTLDLPQHPDGLVITGNSVWISGGKNGKLERYKKSKSPEVMADKSISEISGADGGITRRGNIFYAATAKERILSRIDPATGLKEDILDLKTLRGGNYSGGIRARNSIVNDLAWHADTLWVAVEAGYSSCILQIDVDKKKILQGFWSPGPKPMGLDFDVDGKRLWVVEGRSNSLVDLDTKGKWLGTEEKIPISAVRSLSIDHNNNFWTADAHDARIYCIKKED